MVNSVWYQNQPKGYSLLALQMAPANSRNFRNIKLLRHKVKEFTFQRRTRITILARSLSKKLTVRKKNKTNVLICLVERSTMLGQHAWSWQTMNIESADPGLIRLFARLVINSSGFQTDFWKLFETNSEPILKRIVQFNQTLNRMTQSDSILESNIRLNSANWYNELKTIN